MPKEFKRFDKMFSISERTIERNRILPNSVMPSEVLKYEKWPFVVESWNQDMVQKAVYEAEGALKWQLFRVTLKGMTTYEKLYCLAKRWDEYNSSHLSMVEKCRIDNYIGALVRGGQLSPHEHRVLK